MNDSVNVPVLFPREELSCSEIPGPAILVVQHSVPLKVPGPYVLNWLLDRLRTEPIMENASEFFRETSERGYRIGVKTEERQVIALLTCWKVNEREGFGHLHRDAGPERSCILTRLVCPQSTSGSERLVDETEIRAIGQVARGLPRPLTRVDPFFALIRYTSARSRKKTLEAQVARAVSAYAATQS
jgi:hypothetical protein